MPYLIGIGNITTSKKESPHLYDMRGHNFKSGHCTCMGTYLTKTFAEFPHLYFDT